MIRLSLILNLIAFTSILLSCTASVQKFAIREGLQIYVYPDEAPPVYEAAGDLQRDLKNVFGETPSIVDQLPEYGGGS